jgi:hypothetical protein
MDLFVRSGGVEFHGQPNESGVGFFIDPDGLEGLDDGVSSKGRSVERPQAHGDFDVPGFLDSRIVSLSGWCIADSAERLAFLGSQLTGWLAEGSSAVTFNHMGRVLWGTARRAPSTAPKFKVNGYDSLEARFQVQLKFANPRLFGESRGFFPTTQLLFNYGNFPATPVYRITGDMPGGYTVFGPAGKTFSVTRPLTGAEVHTIDMADGRLRVNGVVVFGGIGATADTWAAPGGGSAPVAVSAGAAITGRISDTYV